MKTFGTLFSGGEGVGIGLTAAGLTHLWGVEYDADIAAVAQRNGFGVHVADVRSVDYASLPRVDWLHASPVCTRASVANANATEAQEDIDTAAGVVRALKAQQPDVFTLENVWGYRDFAAFRLILNALGDGGYFYDFEHVNCADFGVPQTRRRLILRASRGLLPFLPEPVPWVGWYEAIADLIPTLPESKLAPWQLARLPQELREHVLFSSNGNNDSFGDHHVEAHDPALSVTAQGLGRARAVLITANGSAGDTFDASKPRECCRRWSEQAQTIGANEHGSKATTGASVVSMTPRALARFQSVPDWYELPDKRTLAARVIGNMVPPLLMQRIAEGMLQ